MTPESGSRTKTLCALALAARAPLPTVASVMVSPMILRMLPPHSWVDSDEDRADARR